ncbi:MAG TPA: sigma 54-interacting transcriptional regulator [Candidatus Babeliales bacterium]|nr:sigma 54-interacting transcriptional regulator [Candidatus Babeliales bacterium]
MNFLLSIAQVATVQNVIGFFVVTTEAICVLIQLGILFRLYKATVLEKRTNNFYYLVIILATGAYGIFNVMVVELSMAPFCLFSELEFKGISRLEPGMMVLQFDAILGFILGLTSSLSRTKKIKILQKCCRLISMGLIIFFVGWTLHTFIFSQLKHPFPLPQIILVAEGFYIIEGAIALGIAFYNFRKETISLLRHHIFTLSFFYMFPYLIWRACTTNFMSPIVKISGTTGTYNRYMYPILSIWFTGMMYYCVRKLLGLRFLNMHKHVQSQSWEKFSFINQFKVLLSKLGSITRLEEMVPLTKVFFENIFGISKEKVHLYFRDSRKVEGVQVFFAHIPTSEQVFMEKVLSRNDGEDSKVIKYLREHKILIRDEIEFTNLYNRQDERAESLKEIIDFLIQIKADVFLPIFKDEKLLAYIIIEEQARRNKFYTDMDRDEMLILCDYLGTFVYLLAHIDFDALQVRERELLSAVYKREQTLVMLKRSIQGYFNMGMTRKIGVLTYGNKEFVYCNQAAKDLLKIDLNRDKGLEITKIMAKMGYDATAFRSIKREIVSLLGNSKVVITASPNLHKNNAVITVANPTVADVIKDEIRLLKDQTKWDYLLALKSTDEGRLLNALIPADTPTLLNCKVLFFEYALTRKTLLFELPSEDDALSFAHVVHQISSRKIFEELSIKRSCDDEGLAIKLFGINPLFQTNQEEGLFSLLSGKGTLYISNMHLLSLAMQNKFLEFLQTGKHTRYKSDDLIESDILLLCSINQNLQDLVARGLFLKELYLELQKSTIWLPAVCSLPEDEFFALAEGLRQQVVYAKLYQNMLGFTDRDKVKLLSGGCMSLHELKIKIQGLVLKKTRRHAMEGEQVIDPAYRVADLELVEAARLGRHVLKNPKVLGMLMKKFKGNQTKVANFLSVNRSTVCRRCFQYGIDVMSNVGE